VILADINEDGEVTVQAPAEGKTSLAKTANQIAEMPSGSLSRLQGIHRGGEGRKGSFALDQAKSQVLRELADRVRPARRKTRGESTRQRRQPGRHIAKETSARTMARTGWRGTDPDAPH
jgi:hypothetical protein